jgi:hypothetical protein
MKLTILILIFLSLTLAVSASVFQENPWQTVSGAGVTLQYRISPDGQYLENQLSANTSGWIAVGYRAANAMQDANIIIGYVSGGNANIRDDWGTSPTSHSSDVSMGGVSNLSATSGTETGGITTLNFTIPMNSGDQYDRELMVTTSYQIILAHGQNGSDNYSSMHADAGFANININAPVAISDPVQPTQPALALLAYPNPFNPHTTISWTQKADASISLQIYNLKGQKVFSKPADSYKAGNHSYVWNGTDNSNTPLPGGSYYVRLISPKSTQTLKIIMLK